MSKEKQVITINNETLPISNCRKFEAGYYTIGEVGVEGSGDCFFIGGKYYRIETGQVVFDNEVGEHVLKNELIVHGILEFEKDGYKLGYFTMTDKNVKVNTPTGSYFAFNEEIFKSNKTYREKLSNGEYYHIDLLDSKEFNKIKVPPQEYKTSLPYDSKDVLNDFLQIYKDLDVPINPTINKYSSLLRDLTFGVEFETIAGFVPNRQLNNLGLIPLRDGSIAGIEYVSVPLSAGKGLQTIVNISEVLKKKTKYNNTCALHVHLGNIPRTKEFILAFFLTTCFIQDDIYRMFPLYKKYNFRIKNKNYSKPYPIFDLISKLDPEINDKNIDKNFDVLFTYLSMGHSFAEYGNDLSKVTSHPADPDGHQKWNIRTRYYLHNLIPLIFGNKTTVEFRIHTPTFDANKIIPFIFMNALLVNFVKDNIDNILKGKGFLTNFGDLRNLLSNVIYNEPTKCNDMKSFHDDIISYIDSRMQKTEDQNRQGNILGKEEHIYASRYLKWDAPIFKKVVPKVKPTESIDEGSKLEFFQLFESIERSFSTGRMTSSQFSDMQADIFSKITEEEYATYLKNKRSYSTMSINEF